MAESTPSRRANVLGIRRAGVSVETDVSVPMRDGTILRADVWRPVGEATAPVLILRTPYNKQRADDLCMAHPAWIARHGYVVVVQDCRGRWLSEGEFVPFVHEANDTEDTVLWAAELPSSNGQVGLYGLSYAGAVQLQGAVRNPDPLVAICPAMASADLYEGWTYTNGAFCLAFAASWATYLGEDIARRRGHAAAASEFATRHLRLNDLYWTLPLRAFPGLEPDGVTSFYCDWIAHETKDDYWTRWDVENELPGVRAAALVVGGLYDSFLEGTVRAFERLGNHARLLLGPWYHMPWIPSFGAADFGAAALSRVNEAQVRFFDQWLRGADPAGEPRVHAFVTGANRWQELDSWPPAGSSMTLYLRASSRANSINGDGRLSEEPPESEHPDVFTYDPAEPVLSVGGHSCCYDSIAPMGPADQSAVETRNDVLVYTSEPFERDCLVAGLVQARLFVSSSARDTDWTIKVCDVDPTGRSINLQESIQRARFRPGSDGAAPVSAGDVACHEFAVGTCSHVFRAGHRVRVLVSSSDFPQWDRNLNTGNPIGLETIADRIVATQTVFHDSDCPSAITLPALEP